MQYTSWPEPSSCFVGACGLATWKALGGGGCQLETGAAERPITPGLVAWLVLCSRRIETRRDVATLGGRALTCLTQVLKFKPLR